MKVRGYKLSYLTSEHKVSHNNYTDKGSTGVTVENSTTDNLISIRNTYCSNIDNDAIGVIFKGVCKQFMRY